MVSNVDANSSKRCKKKVQTVAEFRNKISILNLRKMNNQKSLDKDLNKSAGNSCCGIINKSVRGVDLTSHKSSTSDLRQYNRKTEVCSTINEYRFDREINRSSSNCEIMRPSLFGSTMRIGNLDHKYTRRIHRRKINHYKALIRILINARAKDLSNTIRFSREDDDKKFWGNIPAIEFSNEKPDTISESDKKNGILSSNRKETDVQTPGPKCAARKSVELSETGGKIFEKDFTASTSENVCNGFENFDDKSTDCEMNFGKNRKSDNDANIPSKIELFNKHPKSLDKIANKKIGENAAAEACLQKCLDPFEFDDSDVIDSHQKSVKDTNILERAKTGRLSSSMKNDQKMQCIELKEDPSTVKRIVKVTSVNDGSKNPSSKKTEQRNSRKNEFENTAVYIPDIAKGGETSRVSLKPSKKWKKDEEAEKVSKKSEARNSNQPEFIVKSKPTGNYCSCKRTKFKDVKTSAYSVPANIEYPSSKIRKRYGNRPAGVKSVENIYEEEKISLIGEKKTAKFYSPLELEYSDVMQSKLDSDHISNNQSRPITNDSSKGRKSLLKKNKVAIRKSAERASEPLKEFSISNFTLSNNTSKNDDTETECSPNNSKTLKVPTFSRYSIPVSIEINIAKDDSRKQFSSVNLIQPKITRYFPPCKVQNKNAPPEKSSNLNSTSDFDENGRRMERKNTVARSKSKSRSLPVIESDVLLKDTEKVIYLKNIPLRKPQLSIPRRDYLYGVLNESETTASNQNIIYRENISSVRNGEEKSRLTHDLILIDDSSSSVASIVPPSYSIFSDDDNNKSIIDINKMLDTQQREDLLAPWESANIYEKINHWHEETFEL